MRRDVLATFALILAVGVLLAPAIMGDSQAAKGDETTPDPPETTVFTIYGFISNISDEDRNVPLEGATVSLLDGTSAVIETLTTGADGRFEFTYDTTENDATYLQFEMQGYTTRSLPDTMVPVSETESNKVTFSLDEVTPDEDGKYRLSGDGYSVKAIGMAITNGTLFGIVKGTNGDKTFSIEGAIVRAVSSNGMQYTATTDPNGYFEMTVPYGSYQVSSACNGFKTTEAATVSTSDSASIDIVMVENEFGIGFLGGLDVPHALMLIGLVFISLMILLMIVLIRKSREKDSEIVVINDLLELEESDEDEFTRP